MVQILGEGAICMCPHGGQLKFMPSHMKADGMDGQILTMQDYTNAMIIGCTMPPPPAGVSPCLKVLNAIDPLGQAMKVNGTQVVTQMVVSFTDKGWPIMVVSPGMSAVSINIDPSLPSFRKAEFAQGAVQKQSGLPIGTGTKGSSSLKPYKDVIMAYWGNDYARRKENLILRGRTIGFGGGTPATLLVYKFDLEGNHKFTKQLTGSVKKNEVEVTWQFDYPDDVSKLPDKVAGDEFYAAPEYFFELKVGGKSAQSGLIEFRDYIEVELADEDGEVFPYAGYTAYFADGSSVPGILDEKGVAKLKDIPPGNVHFAFSKIFEEKKVIAAEWGVPFVMRDEIVKLRGQTSGFADGISAIFRILEHDQIGGDDPVDVLTGTIKDDRVEVEWKVKYIKDVDDLKNVPVGDPSYFSPEYYFQLEVQGKLVKSKIVEFRDWLEMELKDEDGNSIPNVVFVAHFADGTQKEGVVDENGKFTLKNVPAGKVFWEFLGYSKNNEAKVNSATQQSDAKNEVPVKHYSLASGVTLKATEETKVNELADTFFQRANKDIVITSATRSPEKQANAMYDKLKLGDDLTKLYKNKNALKEITDAYDAGINEQKSGAEIIKGMTEVIEGQVKKNVYISAHLKSGAVDVRSKDMSKEEKEHFKIAAKEVGLKVIEEGKPPHFHLEL